MLVGLIGDQDGEGVWRKEGRRAGNGEREGVCSWPSHRLRLVLIIQDDPLIHLRDKDGEVRDLREPPSLLWGWTRMPTMLCVNMEMSCVVLSGKRWTRRPSLGGDVNVNATDWFLLMSLTSLVTAWSSWSVIGVTEPAQVWETECFNANFTFIFPLNI